MKLTAVIFQIALLSCSNIALAVDNKPYTPESLLPQGVDEAVSVNPYTGESGPARKGTVAATLNNIALLNKLLLAPASPKNDAQINQIIKTIEPLQASLRHIGVFNLFSVSEWLADSKEQPGRTLVAVLYLQKFPKEMSDKIKSQLKEIYHQSNSSILKHHIKQVLPEI